MKTHVAKVFLALLLCLLATGVLAQSDATHSHDHPAVAAGSEILPALGEQGWQQQIVEVTASAEAFTPEVIQVNSGEPIVVVFSNDSDLEHHFHILDLEPQDLSWFMVEQNHLDTFDLNTLFSVTRAADHICDAASGICKLGINVHLHANPHSFDAIMFTAPLSGSFEVVCPLHEQMTMRFVVN